jgi:hypothetical protein
MPQVVKTDLAGETTPLFIQFVMMQHQQALFALGQHPHRPPHAPPPNLALGKVFIDQLEMLRGKTRGNLTADEAKVLETALAELRVKYVAAQEGGR